MGYAPTYALNPNFNIFSDLKEMILEKISTIFYIEKDSSYVKELEELYKLSDIAIESGKLTFYVVSTNDIAPNEKEKIRANQFINLLNANIYNMKNNLEILKDDKELYKKLEDIYYITIAVRQAILDRLDPSFNIFGAIDEEYILSDEFDIVEYAKACLKANNE
ncbi:hypothetical protein AVCANL279_07415 [Campylobacter canadensis]|nr:hypothetical protein [Campylobacter canadensis]MBZ7995155.1 hypothetical protein [Campylobacter canadensis]MBZ7997147.1 hypothetical protein [Campylobacter canadensis]MBZ8000520.1 hypothetical protein [Campylobacter canadensis]MBZ8003831.1 hypothetical protein [Campylobacter canadensis]